jgi:hypothetical protein
MSTEVPMEEGRPRPSNLPYSVWLDVSITRRKSYHLVVDHTDTVVFRAMRFSQIVAWLANMEIKDYRLCAEGWTFGVAHRWSTQVEEK